LEALKQCLLSCLAQQNVSYEILLVANLQDPALEAAVGKIPHRGKIKILVTGERNVNRARNAGILRSRGENLLFLDEDCVLPNKRYFSNLERILKRRPDLQGVGGRYLSPPDSGWVVRGYNAMTGAWLQAHSRLGLSRYLLGGNACYRRAVFARGFRFDESIGWGGDETEFQDRLFASGLRLATFESLNVIHNGDNSLRRALTRAWSHGLAKQKGAAPAPPNASAFLKAAWREPALLPFSLLHFPALLAAQAKHAPKFPR
jgi:glycosyltransferase involved in cell wall biosynthesis